MSHLKWFQGIPCLAVYELSGRLKKKQINEETKQRLQFSKAKVLPKGGTPIFDLMGYAAQQDILLW